jgi:2C-methyl-D-erythritol 2,4-cyclodiphosphate synthase
MIKALGHSDADVLLHAICDALLGAACLGDIGVHFPDTSQEFKNIDSKILLAKTFELIKKEGYSIINIDSTLCLEAPKIKPYVAQMQEVIAASCHFHKRYFHQSHYHRNHGFCWKKRRSGGACHLPAAILIHPQAYSQQAISTT